MSRRIVINAESVAKRDPAKFWHPSPSLLRRLRTRTEVQLRVVKYDDVKGADLWDNEPIWVRLTGVRSSECVGTITISEVRAKGFRVGDEIRFSKDRIFDLWEVGPRGMQMPNRGKARFIRGKDVIVGLTYLNPDKSVKSRLQFHGTIEVAGAKRGIGIRRKGHLGLFTLPPDLRSVQPARPGSYRLKTSGEVIEDPTFECTWTITAPR